MARLRATREEDVRAAIESEFGSAVPYRRPVWSVGFRSVLYDELAALNREATAGRSLAVLAPARTDPRWWWDFCVPWEVRFLRGRVRFPGERSGAPFPSAVVLMGPVADCDVCRWWDVRTGEMHTLPVSRGEDAHVVVGRRGED